MPGTVFWFLLVLMACIGAWCTGQAVTRAKDPARHWGLMCGAVLLLLIWTALIRNPAVAVHVIPVAALARLEGVGAAPIFVFIISLAWGLSVLRRQRVLLAASLMICAVYFLQGGAWMMKPTPTNAYSHRIGDYFVKQTQDYSCVPAASATALRMLGVMTDEAEMAELSETRAGSGATLLRALNGIHRRLQYTKIKPELLEPNYDQLLKIDPPMLTPMRFEPTQLHMVTLLEVRPDLVIIADPHVGIELLSRETFEKHYSNQIIAFTGGDQRATAMDVLAQQPNMAGISAYLEDDARMTALGHTDQP